MSKGSGRSSGFRFATCAPSQPAKSVRPISGILRESIRLQRRARDGISPSSLLSLELRSSRAPVALRIQYFKERSRHIVHGLNIAEQVWLCQLIVMIVGSVCFWARFACAGKFNSACTQSGVIAERRGTQILTWPLVGTIGACQSGLLVNPNSLRENAPSHWAHRQACLRMIQVSSLWGHEAGIRRRCARSSDGGGPGDPGECPGGWIEQPD